MYPAGMPQKFYPATKVSLVIRFEDYGRLVLPVPTKTSIRLKGTSDARGDLKVVDDPNAPAGTKRFLLQADDPPPAQGQKTAASDGWSGKVTHVRPLNANWKVTSPRVARTLSLKFNWDDLPIDPRCVRAMGVEFYMGTLSPELFASAMTNATSQRPSADAGAEPLYSLPDRWVDPKGRVRSNLRFRGWADSIKLDFADGNYTIELECTDNTRLLINQPAPTKFGIDPKMHIDEAIAHYLSHFPQFAGIGVEYRPLVERRAAQNGLKALPPIVGEALQGSAFRPDVGPPVAKGGGGTSSDSNSVWDYLSMVCESVAHRIYVEEVLGATVVVIAQNTAIVDKRVTARADETYIPRDVGGAAYDVRTMVYGANIISLGVKHEYTRKAAQNIEMRSYDLERKTVTVGRFPEKGDRIVRALPAKGQADQAWTVMKAPNGIRDVPTLKKIAEEYYNQVGRTELELTIKTRDLASYGAGNEDPDLLDMRNGDPLRILLGVGQGSAGETESLFGSSAGVEQHFKSIGFDAGFAAAYARSYTDAGFQTAYRVKEVGYTWDHEKGIDIDITAHNYIEARVDRPAATLEQVVGVKKPKAPLRK